MGGNLSAGADTTVRPAHRESRVVVPKQTTREELKITSRTQHAHDPYPRPIRRNQTRHTEHSNKQPGRCGLPSQRTLGSMAVISMFSNARLGRNGSFVMLTRTGLRDVVLGAAGASLSLRSGYPRSAWPFPPHRDRVRTAKEGSILCPNRGKGEILIGEMGKKVLARQKEAQEEGGAGIASQLQAHTRPLLPPQSRWGCVSVKRERVPTIRLARGSFQLSDLPNSERARMR